MGYDLLPNTLVIGLGHKARNGKDSVAKFIQDAYPRSVRLYSFADALYSVCTAVHGMTVKDPALLQRVGTDEMRAKDPDVWVRCAYWKIRREEPRVAIITDTRFQNEVTFIKSIGGHAIKVVRLNPSGTQFIAQDRDPLHRSETDLDWYGGWDKVITAFSGDMESLEEQALLAFRDIIGDKLWGIQ